MEEYLRHIPYGGGTSIWEAYECVMADLLALILDSTGDVIRLSSRECSANHDSITFHLRVKYGEREWTSPKRFVFRRHGMHYRFEVEDGSAVARAIYEALTPALRAWEGDLISGVIE